MLCDLKLVKRRWKHHLAVEKMNRINRGQVSVYFLGEGIRKYSTIRSVELVNCLMFDTLDQDMRC